MGRNALIHFFIFYFFNFPTPCYPLGPTRRKHWDFQGVAMGAADGGRCHSKILLKILFLDNYIRRIASISKKPMEFSRRGTAGYGKSCR